MNNRKTFLAVLFLVVLMLLVSATTSLVPSKNEALAATNRPLHGWAWSSNIGWIKFDCDTCNAQLEDNGPGMGPLTGYAWANPADATDQTRPPINNIGWFNLNPSGGYPTDPSDPGGDDAHGARIEAGYPTNKVTGWARFTVGSSPDSAGWDGWVKMSGNWSNGVHVRTYSNGTKGLAGFAWGGDTVGWISFDPKYDSSTDTECNPAHEVCIGGDADLSVTCYAEPSTIPPGVSTDVTWHSFPTGGASPYTSFAWTDNDGTIGMTQNVNKSYHPDTMGGSYPAQVRVTDSAVHAATCSNSVVVSSNCPAGQHGTPPDCFCNGTDDQRPPCNGDGGGGTLTVTEGDEVVYIGEQASGQPASSIVSISRHAAEIKATGGAVNNVRIITPIESQKSGGSTLDSLTDPLCSLTTDPNVDNFQSCDNLHLNPSTLSVGQTAYFRIQIPDYLEKISQNSPYAVLIEGDPIDNPEGGSVTPKATLIFQYRVGTYVPQ